MHSLSRLHQGQSLSLSPSYSVTHALDQQNCPVDVDTRQVGVVGRGHRVGRAISVYSTVKPIVYAYMH